MLIIGTHACGQNNSEEVRRHHSTLTSVPLCVSTVLWQYFGPRIFTNLVILWTVAEKYKKKKKNKHENDRCKLTKLANVHINCWLNVSFCALLVYISWSNLGWNIFAMLQWTRCNVGVFGKRCAARCRCSWCVTVCITRPSVNAATNVSVKKIEITWKTLLSNTLLYTR